MELSVVLPAYNEVHRIERGVQEVLDYLARESIDGEVIVVDDGSTDGTMEALAAIANAHANVHTLSHESNRGKGAAVRTGVAAAGGDRILFTDVDQSTPMAEWPRLAAALDAGHDVVLGSREVVGAVRVVPQPWYRRSMGYVFMLLRGCVVLPGFIDTQCGFKAFTAEAARLIFARARLDGFCFDVEILAIADHHHLEVAEVPVHWTDDPRSSVSPLSDSLRMLADLFRIRRNRNRGLYD